MPDLCVEFLVALKTVGDEMNSNCISYVSKIRRISQDLRNNVTETILHTFSCLWSNNVILHADHFEIICYFS